MIQLLIPFTCLAGLLVYYFMIKDENIASNGETTDNSGELDII